MLKVEFSKDGIKARANLLNSWHKISKALHKVDSNKELYELKMNDSDVHVEIKTSKGVEYSMIEILTQYDEHFLDLYESCKIIQYGDKDYIPVFKKDWEQYESCYDMKLAYDDFQNEKRDSLTPVQYEEYKNNIFNMKFEVLTLFKNPVLFYPERISKDKIPQGIYRYEVREDDECRGEMVEIAEGIMYNFWGTILSNKEINLHPYGYRNIDETKDIKDEYIPSMTLNQYVNDYPSKQKERNVR